MTAACGAPSAPGPVNNVTVDPPPRTPVAVDPAAPLGVLGFPAAAAPSNDAPYWVAKTPIASVVVPSPAPLVAGTTYTTVSAGGERTELTAGAVTSIGYGCDQTPLDVVPLAGAAVKPTLVWVVPSPARAAWKPTALAVVSATKTPALATWTAGPLVVELARTDKTHATMRIALDGKPVHDETVEAYWMEGADAVDLDLTQGRWPGIPNPEAVFAIAPDGPYLVVSDRSGFEGIAFETLFIDGNGRARVIESLGLSAYFCAF
jgi:hypothetical protein